MGGNSVSSNESQDLIWLYGYTPFFNNNGLISSLVNSAVIFKSSGLFALTKASRPLRRN